MLNAGPAAHGSLLTQKKGGTVPFWRPHAFLTYRYDPYFAAPLSFPEIAEVCKTVFPGEGMRQNAALGYAVVDSLLKSGEAELSVARVPGMTPELTAPKFLIALIR